MAGSRLEKFGTVFTRVRDLMRAAVLKEKDKPIWYDVYAAFPPKREPLFVKSHTKMYGKSTDNVTGTVPDIFYKEDAVRAKFFEVYGNGPRAFELGKANFVSICQRFVEKYQELEVQGQLEEEALFEGAGRALLSEGIILRRRGGASVAPESREPVLGMKLKDILAEQPSEPLDQSQSTQTQPSEPLDQSQSTQTTQTQTQTQTQGDQVEGTHSPGTAS
ncbi:hypothetical protein SKAU_G00425250 [Synaphobranchus kaupii]|uniref:Small ribosomal subunit protein mS23 n=1 Tax=Synaphobranchus kaupii TaxID=118154 RepID=A0A9Q1E5Q1_SYNKA|nr:hypothetical protein SKAU_G00425250 [Synaphobranchus kaupii]